MFGFAKHGGTQPAKSEKMMEIKERLSSLLQPSEVGGEGATLTNDAPLPADKRATIAREEALVRQALGLVGMNYDALIALDKSEQGGEGPSAYAQAVAANPQILQQVMAAESPVLEALKVAIGFKPFAEFTQKYGATPEAIKAAIKAEALAEAETTPSHAREALPFSRSRPGARTVSPPSNEGGLQAVFKK